MQPKVLVDANVLFSRTLRDWLSLLSLEQTFFVYWTEDILAETIYRLRRKHQTWDGARITQLRDRLTTTFEGGRVDDFVIDGTFQGADLNDAHVHAAAVACNVNFVLTADGGFKGPGVDLDQLPYEVYDPDSFFVLVDDSAPDAVHDMTRQQLEYWLRRRGEADLGHHLRKAGCPKFAKRVGTHLRGLPIPKIS